MHHTTHTCDEHKEQNRQLINIEAQIDNEIPRLDQLIQGNGKRTVSQHEGKRDESQDK